MKSTDDEEVGDVVKTHCPTPGLSGTTDLCVVRHDDGTFEARMGIAIFGYTNMKWSEIERINDPFSDEWRDIYCAGKGKTREAAIKALEADRAAIHRSLWLQT